jgi:hypothetical protein
MRGRLPVVAVLVAVAVNSWPSAYVRHLSRISANLPVKSLPWTSADARERDHDGLAVWDCGSVRRASAASSGRTVHDAPQPVLGRVTSLVWCLGCLGEGVAERGAGCDSELGIHLIEV